MSANFRRQRTLEQLVDLALRVQAHLKATAHSAEANVRWEADRVAFKADPDPAVDDMNLHAYSRTARWIMSWNRRHGVVATALAARLRALGVTPDMLRVDHVE